MINISDNFDKGIIEPHWKVNVGNTSSGAYRAEIINDAVRLTQSSGHSGSYIKLSLNQYNYLSMSFDLKIVGPYSVDNAGIRPCISITNENILARDPDYSQLLKAGLAINIMDGKTLVISNKPYVHTNVGSVYNTFTATNLSNKTNFKISLISDVLKISIDGVEKVNMILPAAIKSSLLTGKLNLEFYIGNYISNQYLELDNFKIKDYADRYLINDGSVMYTINASGILEVVNGLAVEKAFTDLNKVSAVIETVPNNKFKLYNII